MPPSARPAPPGFFRHLLLLWGLRLRIGLNRGGRRGVVLAVLGFTGSSAPGLFLGIAFFGLMRHPAIAASEMWSRFFLNLLCFVTASTWALWPLMSAGVDDHSELSRYQAFPISSFWLLVASTLASLFEPRAFVFYAPVAGATLGFLSLHPPASWAMVALLFALYAVMNAAWSRVGLHLVLNVLRQERSAEMIGGFFVVFLAAASFLPPIDTSWLKDVGGGLSAVSSTLIADAALALSRVPPGFFGHGVFVLAEGRVGVAVLLAVLLAAFTALPMYVAWRLLVRFHQQIGRAGPPVRQPRAQGSDPFARSRGRFRTLAIREALDLWRNPKARLLASVPFLLAILLKLISGRDLFVYLLGDAADAWLLGALSLYGAIVLASTFSQNTFGYDGHGLVVFFAAPLDLAEVLRAKNLVQGLAGAALALVVSVFYVVYFRAFDFFSWACAVAGTAALIPVLLAVGNLLSLFFPVKFHASMKRRDKLPLAAALLGVGGASIGAFPFVTALRLSGHAAPGVAQLLIILGGAVLGWTAYRALLPLSLALLERRRELVLRAVTRD
ncbi:MAG: hypothetical protein IRZ16_16290 [Myxococcaceae bacterium]|nr:hypothetical protein [Myxococcaceae bacterium]